MGAVAELFDPMTALIITGLAIGVGIVTALLLHGARIQHNTRGHRLGRWLSVHAGDRPRAASWWRL